MGTTVTVTVSTLVDFADGLTSGSIKIIDLTQPLSDRTPIIQLPPPLVNTPGWKMHELSHYDERGPAWYWNWFEGGEHVGTHLDAPIHWVTARDSEDVSQVPAERLIRPAAVVIGRSAEAAANPDYLLTREEIRAFEAEHGPLPTGDGCCSGPAGMRGPTTSRRS